MEGKAVLFKNFADVDVFDIEVDEPDVDKFVECVARLEPTFGGINLEDIGAPACFEIEKQLRLVTSGAGAAAQACLHQLISLGMPKENIIVTDRTGTIYKGRTEKMDTYKEYFAVDTDTRTLSDALKEADVFLGLSAPGTLDQDMVRSMADKPIIMALANPTPEILPEEAHAARPDVIMGTGRSDYPNQVNNVLCFPFIFRGALDCGATTINEEMKVACVKALADLAMAETSDIEQAAFGGKATTFGPEKLLPKPFDPRLILELAPAVAKAAMDTGVATRPMFCALHRWQLTTGWPNRSLSAAVPSSRRRSANLVCGWK